MNINTSEYANTEQTEAGVGTDQCKDRTLADKPEVPKAELEAVLYILRLLSDCPEQGRDRGDGERS